LVEQLTCNEQAVGSSPSSGSLSRRRPREPTVLPLGEELAALVHYYQHLHNEVEHEKPEGSTRRELEDKLLGVRERFDRLLEEWVPDEDLREQWREYIHGRRPEPDEPAGIEPLAFQGVNDAGSIVQIRGGQADEYGVWVDGKLQERIAARKDLSVDKPVLHFRWDGKEISETFNTSEDALRALAAFRADPDSQPPWDYASELLADGLIDVHFDLTPRGKRVTATR
jgi:hypothetical protein